MLIAAPGAMGVEVLLQPPIKASAAAAGAARSLAALGRRRRRLVAQTWGLSSNRTENRHKLIHASGWRPAFADSVAPAIREAQAAGAKTLRQIAAALNGRGIATARGGKWEATTVANVLLRVGRKRVPRQNAISRACRRHQRLPGRLALDCAKLQYASAATIQRLAFSLTSSATRNPMAKPSVVGQFECGGS